MEIKSLENFKNFIENSEKILLINHIKMDPDAFWSLWALYLILEKIWKNVKAINDFETPKEFDFLLEKRIIEPELDLEKFNPDLIISLDAWSLSQLWEIFLKNKEIFESKNFIVIDHHQTNTWFWKLNLIFPKYSSTCELIFDICKKIWFEKYFDEKIATLLIAGIYTDTNVFYNQNTTSNTHLVASELLKFWADFRSPIYNFFQKISLKRLKLFWKAIWNIKELEINNIKIIYTFLTEKDFFETKTEIQDTTWIINKLSNLEETEIIFLFYKNENNTIKVSFRSKNTNIWEFCASFIWWGWHKNAAWFNLDCDFEKAEEIILKSLKIFLK